MNIRRFIANCLISITLIMCVPFNVCANETSEIKVEKEKSIDNISNIPSINEQLDIVYTEVGKKLNIENKYVKALHLLAGGKAVYADKAPNIRAEETVNTMKAPFELEGANIEYIKFDDIVCADQSIERPSAYYIPDAAYSVTLGIVKIMNDRLVYDRGGLQVYFDALKEEVKKEILFIEAVMIYTGESEEAVNNFYKAYEKVVYDKEKYENIVAINEDGRHIIKDIYKDTFISNGISNEGTLNNIAVLISYDEGLACTDDTESLKEQYTLPYKVNYTSRENMMIASICLIGKVRYTWGGGHSGASKLDGINPVWINFEGLYSDIPVEISDNIDNNENNIDNSYNVSFGKCIKPSGSWCPIHGESETDCSFKQPYVKSLDEYIEVMDNYIDTTELKTDKFKELMENVEFDNGINVDTLNGLDCSGYIAWLYNQITDRYSFNSVAKDFASLSGMRSVEFGSKLLPGDIFAWNSHIVTIVGRVSDTNKVYVTTESTPNILKFGVVYYDGASKSEIDKGTEIAKQANELIGGLNDYELPHIYCMDTVGIYSNTCNCLECQSCQSCQDCEICQTEIENLEIVEEGSNLLENTETSEYREIARLGIKFIDEDTVVHKYNKHIKDMYANEIIQYTLRKLPYTYVTGYNTYSGDIFDKSQVSADIKVN